MTNIPSLRKCLFARQSSRRHSQSALTVKVMLRFVGLGIDWDPLWGRVKLDDPNDLGSGKEMADRVVLFGCRAADQRGFPGWGSSKKRRAASGEGSAPEKVYAGKRKRGQRKLNFRSAGRLPRRPLPRSCIKHEMNPFPRRVLFVCLARREKKTHGESRAHASGIFFFSTFFCFSFCFFSPLGRILVSASWGRNEMKEVTKTGKKEEA